MTSAPEAKRRLLALLQGYAGLTGTTVRYGRPTREGQIGDRRQMVWLGPIAEGDIEWGALGRNRQDETYTIEVGAWVSKPGDDEEGTEQACAVLLSAITAAVRSDPRLGAFLKEGMTSGRVARLGEPRDAQGCVRGDGRFVAHHPPEEGYIA
jgi:hypothetical protein